MVDEIRFDGQAAIVTGAGNGLGRGYAIELAARGAAVVCNDIVVDAAESIAAEIRRNGGRAVAESSSVATAEGGAAIVATAVEAFGAVDIVVNNAGQLRNAAFADMTADDFDAVVATHLGGAFHVTHAAFRHMTAAGYGRIVFTSSSAAFGSPWQANYAAAKAGLIGLCNAVAMEGAGYGITASVIMPMALTGIADSGPAPFPPELLAETIDALKPVARYMTVDNVVPLVVYLASRSCAVTQRIFSVGCGHVAEVFVGMTGGWYAPDAAAGWSPEDLSVSLASVLDRTGYDTPGSMNDVPRLVARKRS